MKDPARCHSGSLEQRLELATSFLLSHGETILEDPPARLLLEEVERRANEVAQVMAALGLSALCTDCAREQGGGCCIPTMTDELDALLVLMNRLLLHPVVLSPRSDGECVFLGAEGCSLFLKPLFCLSYLCRRIRQTVPPEGLETLLTATSGLHRTQIRLEQRLQHLLP